MENIREVARRYRVGYVALGAGSAALLLLALGLVFVYGLPESWTVSKKARAVVPMPMVLVDGRNAVPMNDLADNLASVKQFYESQDFSSLGLRVDFSTPEGEQRLKVREREIVNKMVEDMAIRRIAEQKGITISDETVTQEVAKQLGGIDEDGVQSIKNRLAMLYGWNLLEFEQKVVLPSLYEESLTKLFESNTDNFVPAQMEIEQAKKMIDDGRDWSDVAKEFSRGITAGKGGELGWFKYDDLVEPLREAAKTQSIGTPGEIIESPLGFHILNIAERKNGVGGEMARVSQIFVPKMTFPDWLASQMQEMDVRVLVREYQWNKETSRVEFRDPAMQDLERKILENAQGDPSFLL